jgi:hypothetical protein
MADASQETNGLASTDVSAADGDGFVPKESTVKFLLAMGFPRRLCEQALQQESGNLDRAIELYCLHILSNCVRSLFEFFCTGCCLARSPAILSIFPSGDWLQLGSPKVPLAVRWKLPTDISTLPLSCMHFGFSSYE